MVKQSILSYIGNWCNNNPWPCAVVASSTLIGFSWVTASAIKSGKNVSLSFGKARVEISDVQNKKMKLPASNTSKGV